jgi:hypothetical protein
MHQAGAAALTELLRFAAPTGDHADVELDIENAESSPGVRRMQLSWARKFLSIMAASR